MGQKDQAFDPAKITRISCNHALSVHECDRRYLDVQVADGAVTSLERCSLSGKARRGDGVKLK
jgi:hypothetical protein